MSLLCLIFSLSFLFLSLSSNLVAEVIEMAAPSKSGDWKTGVRMLLSNSKPKRKRKKATHIASQSACPLLPRFRYQGAARIARWPAAVAEASARRQALSASTVVASSLGGPLLPSHHCVFFVFCC